MTSIARHVLVRGRVQGVAFRHHTKLEARARGLRGWVRNLDDGSVEAWLEGGTAEVEALVVWLRRGPPAAQVEALDVEVVEPAGHERFVVRFEPAGD